MAKHEQDQLYVTNPTDEYFSWPWAGQVYGIAPGQKIIWPRFLAEHYAKHLADFILLKREKANKDAYMAANHGSDKDYKHKSLLNSKKERPLVIDTILTGVYSYFRPQRKDDPNAMLQQQIQQMNPQQNANEPKPLDLGPVEDDRAIGVLKDEEKELTPEEIGDDPGGQQPAPTAPQLPNSGTLPPQNTTGGAVAPPLPGQTTIPVPDAPKLAGKRSRADLFAEAQKLGLKVEARMTNAEVEEMIKKFFG